MKSIIKQEIRILKGGWRIAEENDDPKYVKLLPVKLLIEGNPKSGYYLIMTPEGLDTADMHFDCIDDAKKEADEYFEIPQIQWS